MGHATRMQVRAMIEGEADALGRIMYDAIQNGRGSYDAAQRNAWLNAPNAGTAWAARLSAQQVWVAEASGRPVGFITLWSGGHVDLAFVAASAQGSGVFSALYHALEAAAVAQRVVRLWTHASVMAQPVFEAKGFHVIRHETVERCGATLARAEMEKTL